MKYQQVSVDFVNMVYTACTYLIIAGVAWIFLRLLQACFWLPRHLQKQNNIQQMLQDKVDGYEKYILECEEKEKAAAEAGENVDNDENCDENSEKPQPVAIDEAKWKERRECLEMLKKELKRVRDGGEVNDWDYLLEEDDEEVNKSEKEDVNEGEKKDGNEGEKKDEEEKRVDNDNNEEEEDKMSEFTTGETDSSDCNTGKSDSLMEKNLEVKKDK